MYLYKCDICGHLQEEGERFFALTEITHDDEEIDIEFCEDCYNRFKNSEKEETK